jgi:hypothetical protein
MPVSSIIGLIALCLFLALTALLIKLYGRDSKGFPHSRRREKT